MKTLMKILGSLILLGVAAFCVFGFLATFEPSNNPGQFLAFRVAYAIIGFGCFAGAILVIVKAARR